MNSQPRELYVNSRKSDPASDRANHRKLNSYTAECCLNNTAANKRSSCSPDRNKPKVSAGMLSVLTNLMPSWRVYDRSRYNVQSLRSLVRESGLWSFCYLGCWGAGGASRRAKLHRPISNRSTRCSALPMVVGWCAPTGDPLLLANRRANNRRAARALALHKAAMAERDAVLMS